MIKLIGLFCFVMAYVHFVPFRLLVNKPFLSLYYAIRDIFIYIWHKKYNICPTGEMIAFCAHFGKGKTLSATHRIGSLYRRYNNKKVWNDKKKCFVVQKIHVISNVRFTDIPSYEPLTSLSQIVNSAYANKSIDDTLNILTVTLVLIDEASVQLNSRNFKSNINADFLNTLLTSRHYHISMFYTSQKFNLTDKLLRDVTQLVYECNKVWRYQCQKIYDATELENATNVNQVKPIKRTGWFVLNRDYNRFDTLAVVDNLKKSFDENDFLSDREILELRAPHYYQEMQEEKRKKKRH